MPDLTPRSESDKLLAALCYFVPVLPGLALFLTPSRANPYLRYHAEQSIVLGAGVILLYALTLPIFFLCLPVLVPLGLQLYFAFKAATTPVFTIPYVTDLAQRLFPDFPR